MSDEKETGRLGLVNDEGDETSDDNVDAICATVRKFMAADNDDGGFIVTDVNGAAHDLNLYYVKSVSEGAAHRIYADYPPDEIAEAVADGDLDLKDCREFRGERFDFLVDEVTHAKMLDGGVIDTVEGVDVLKWILEKGETALRERDERRDKRRDN
jgi:hypothetical protein